MKTCYLLCIGVVFSLVSCETAVDVDLPDIRPKLVVNCIFHPDSVFKIHTSTNVSISDWDSSNYEAFENIENAEVVLYKNGQLISQLTNRDKGYYIADNLFPMADTLYRVEVKAEGYNAVWAESRTPSEIRLDTFFWNRQWDPVSGLSEVFKATMVWRDPPGEDYYYIYTLKSTSEYPYSYSNPGLFVYDCPLFPDVTRPDVFVFNDHLFEGDTMSLECYCELGYFSPVPDTIYYAFYLVHVSKEFYQWALTTMEQNTFQGYFSEPVQVYSNIQGGLGLFTGYTVCGDSIAYTWFDYKKGGE